MEITLLMLKKGTICRKNNHSHVKINILFSDFVFKKFFENMKLSRKEKIMFKNKTTKKKMKMKTTLNKILTITTIVITMIMMNSKKTGKKTIKKIRSKTNKPINALKNLKKK